MLKEITTRAQAKQAGLTRYFTGKPCPQGHNGERFTYNSRCVQCNRDYANKFNKDNLRQRLRRTANQAKSRTKARIGKPLSPFRRIEKDDYTRDAIGRTKPTWCQLCGRNDRDIVFDHDHTTGRFRGWICVACNSTLGFAADNTSTLLNMVRYLNAHKQESA